MRKGKRGLSLGSSVFGGEHTPPAQSHSLGYLKRGDAPHMVKLHPYVEVNAYPENRKYSVVNNTYTEQKTTVYTTDGNSFDLTLEANEIIWYTTD